MGDGRCDLQTTSTRNLLRLYAEILTELLARKVIRSRNAPAGDLAETLVTAAYDGELAPPSAKSWDVRSSDKRRLQVKCRVISSAAKGTAQFSVFRSWDFDACVFVVFDCDAYALVRAVEVPVEVVRSLAHEAKWVAGHRLTLREFDGVGIDVTHRIARVYS